MDSGIPSVARRKYFPVGSDAVSMLHTVTDETPESILKTMRQDNKKNAHQSPDGRFLQTYRKEKLQRFKEFNQIIALCCRRCTIRILTCCRLTAVPQDRFIDIARTTIV